MDMEPLRKIMGWRDIAGIQNGRHFEPEVKYVEPEVLFNYVFYSLKSLPLGIQSPESYKKLLYTCISAVRKI